MAMPHPPLPPSMIKTLKEETFAQKAALVAVGAIVGGLTTKILDIAAFLSHYIGSTGVKVALVVAVGLAGLGASWFKRKNQMAYAFVEVTFGLTSSVIIVASLDLKSFFPFEKGSSLVGLAYVIARGINNFSEARDKNIVASSQALPTAAVTVPAVRQQTLAPAGLLISRYGSGTGFGTTVLQIRVIGRVVLKEVTGDDMDGRLGRNNVIAMVNLSVANQNSSDTSIESISLRITGLGREYLGERVFLAKSENSFPEGRPVVKRGVPIKGWVEFRVEGWTINFSKIEVVAGKFVVRVKDGFDKDYEAIGMTAYGPSEREV